MVGLYKKITNGSCLFYTIVRPQNLSPHTLKAFCLPHDNATALYWHYYQHHNENRIEVDNRPKKLPKRWYTLDNTCNSLRGGRVEKLLHCPASKEKLTYVTERETDIEAHTQVPPFSVRELRSLPLSQAQLAGKTFFHLWERKNAFFTIVWNF